MGFFMNHFMGFSMGKKLVVHKPGGLGLLLDHYSSFLPVVVHGGGGGRSQESPRAYSPKVLTQIPMKYLLDHARRYQGKYSTLYPALLRLTATQFPQLCLVCEWVTEKREIAGECVHMCHSLVHHAPFP